MKHVYTFIFILINATVQLKVMVWIINIRRNHGDQPVLARVIRTGFLTNRGALIAAILYPPPADFKFDKDSYKFIGILVLIATCGLIYTLVLKVISKTFKCRCLYIFVQLYRITVFI